MVEKFSVVIRKMLVIVTKRPRAKTIMSSLFWLRGSFDCHRTCCGSAMMRISVAIENPAFAYQFIVSEIQVPGIVLSQALGIGVHCHIEEAEVATM